MLCPHCGEDEKKQIVCKTIRKQTKDVRVHYCDACEDAFTSVAKQGKKDN